MTKNKWLERPVDVSFLLDSGLLFEINRSILHLVGVALAVKKNEQGKLALTIKDSRAEPEKLVFDPDILLAGKEKLQVFMTEFGRSQDERRISKRGWGCQW